MLSSDLHTHTLYSHGTGTPEQNVVAAIEAGLEEIAISEHGPGHLFYGVRGEKLKRLRREVDMLASKYAGKIRVLMGIECNLTGYGLCDLPDGGFDVKILAYHKGGAIRDGFALSRFMEAFKLGKPDPIRTANALLEAADRYKIGIFSHPGLYVKADIPTLAKGARELGVKLEINASRVTMTAEELREAVNAGAQLIIGSDAHSPDRAGDGAKAVKAAEEAGVLDEVVNLRA